MMFQHKKQKLQLNIIALALLMMLTSLLVVISQNANAKNTEISTARQQALYNMVRQDCGSCHGMTLKGGLGSPLNPADLKGKSVDFITLTIMNGRPNTAMPPWNEIVTKQEAKWIAQQLKKGAFK